MSPPVTGWEDESVSASVDGPYGWLVDDFDGPFGEWLDQVGATVEKGRITVRGNEPGEYWLNVTAEQFAEHWPEYIESASPIWPTSDPRTAAWNLLSVHLDEAMDTADEGATQIVLRESGFFAI
jgi:hypothetical protein